MELFRVIAGALSIGAIAVLGTASAQDYPSKPVRIVTTLPGGGSDFIARLTARGISGAFGQPVVVLNAGRGVVPPTTVAQAPPDGYTILLYTAETWRSALFEKDLAYDAMKDFAPVTILGRTPNLFVTTLGLPAKSVKEVIALARARPGDLNYSTSAIGSTAHLAGELFKSLAKINITRINYASATIQAADLVSGEVQLAISTPGSVSSLVKAGKLRALAVTSAQPSPQFPGLPTVAASVPGYEIESIYGVWVPVKTPQAIVKRLNQEIVHYVRTPEAKERFLSIELQAEGSSPEEFAAVIKTDLAKLSKVFKVGNLQ